MATTNVAPPLFDAIRDRMIEVLPDVMPTCGQGENGRFNRLHASCRTQIISIVRIESMAAHWARRRIQYDAHSGATIPVMSPKLPGAGFRARTPGTAQNNPT